MEGSRKARAQAGPAKLYIGAMVCERSQKVMAVVSIAGTCSRY